MPTLSCFENDYLENPDEPSKNEINLEEFFSLESLGITDNPNT